VRMCNPLKARACNPLKVRACTPLKVRACNPLMARTCSPLKVIGTSTQGSTFMRKHEIDSSRGLVIQNSKDWTLNVGNLCS